MSRHFAERFEVKIIKNIIDLFLHSSNTIFIIFYDRAKAQLIHSKKLNIPEEYYDLSANHQVRRD